MTSLDRKIQDYFYWNFREIPDPEIPRDFESEKNLSKIAKAELILINNIDSFFGELRAEIAGVGYYNINKKRRFLKICWEINYTNFPKEFFLNDTRINIHHSKEFLEFSKNLDLPFFINPDFFCLYCTINDFNIEEAINDIFTKFPDYEYIPPENGEYLHITTIDPKFLYYIYSFTQKTLHDPYKYYCFSNHKRGKKILVPFFSYQNLVVPISEQKTIPLINIETENDDFNYAILTPCIETLCHNIHISSPPQETLVKWLSWYGEVEKISEEDLKLLCSKKIYYLLRKSPNFTQEEVFYTGEKLRLRLKKLGVTDFKYISYLDFGVKAMNNIFFKNGKIPAIYSPAEIKNLINSPLSSSFTKESHSHENILEPFIFRNTALLIHGQEDNDKTCFAVNLTYSTALQLNPFQNRILNQPLPKVLYLFNSQEESRLSIITDYFHKLYKLRLKILSKTNDLGINADLPSFIPICINSKNTDTRLDDIFLSIKNYGTESTIPKVVFLDNVLEINSRHDNKNGLLIKSLKSLGWAVVVISPDNITKTEYQQIIKDISFDGRVKINSKKSNHPAKLLMNVEIQKAYRFPLGYRKKFTCELDFNSKTPEFIRCSAKQPHGRTKFKTPKARDKFVSKVEKLLAKGHSPSIIIKKLNLNASNESLIKKIKYNYK